MQSHGPCQNSEQRSFQASSSVFSLLRKTVSDSDGRTDSDKLFQTDAAAGGKARSTMVARSVRGVTMADVLEEKSRDGTNSPWYEQSKRVRTVQGTNSSKYEKSRYPVPTLHI